MDEGGGAEVVEAILSEDLGTGLEPDGLGDLDAVVGKDLREDNAERSEQGPAGVDQLQLAVPGEGLGVGREADGIPAVVTRELSSQVRGGGVGEGACRQERTVRNPRIRSQDTTGRTSVSIVSRLTEPLGAIRSIPGGGASGR